VSENVSFRRKITYIVAIAVLLLPLALLGRPKTVRDTKGGLLAEERERIGLSQAQLGKIDPASESMKLATLGLRGIAANLLWQQAMEYKKKEQWDDLSSACEQIVRLEPNYVMVWEFQAHNLSYNVSTEFDDYRQRYNWVKRGIDYLIEGTEYNRDDPRLIWYVGWILGQKINRSDEKVSFRKLYRDDTDFHEMMRGQNIAIDETRGPDQKPDSWLASRLWYIKGQDAVDANGGGLKGKNPPIFHQAPTKSLINYAEDLQKERKTDVDTAKALWEECYNQWTKVYGARDLPSVEGFPYRMNDKEALMEKLDEEWAKLDQMVPGERIRMIREKAKANNVPEDVLALIEKPLAERTFEEKQMYWRLEDLFRAAPEDVAARAKPEELVKARNLARQIANLDTKVVRISRSRAVINYEYWRDRCQAESTDDCALARQLLFEGGKLADEASFEEAEKKFQEAFDHWNQVYVKFPTLMDDANAEDVVLAIEKYISVLQALERGDKYNQVLPSNFPLAKLLRRFERRDLLAKVQQAEKEERDKKAAQEQEQKEKQDAGSQDEKPAEGDKATEGDGATPAATEEPSNESKGDATKDAEPKAEGNSEAPKSDQPAAEGDASNPKPVEDSK
jgi:hypothetical protein